jgi:hypothetical protein
VYTRFWWGNLRERDHFEDPDVDGRIILRWRALMDRCGSEQGQAADTCVCGDELSGSIKYGEFLE